MKIRLSIFCCLLIFFAGEACAQKNLLRKVDSLLISFQKTNADTNYIVRPKQKLTLRLLNNISGANLLIREHEKGKMKSDMHLESDLKWTIALSGNYRGLSLSLSANPSKIFDWYHDFEFNLNAYGNKMGLDFIFQRSSSLEGDINDQGESIHVDQGLLKSKSVNVNYYYIFNHRRFSYPAAFTQSYLQKRSAGSFMLGASFESYKLDLITSDDEEEYVEDEESDDNIMKMKFFGIGVGYGYNFVPSKSWLIHFSVLPTFIVWRKTNMENDGFSSRRSHPLSMPDMLNVGRLSVIHYFGNQFAGLTAIINHNHLGQSGNDMMDYFKWRVRIIYGIRF